MKIFLKKLHKWVGLITGIQVLLWLGSGLLISLLDPAKVSGSHWSQPASKLKSLHANKILDIAELPADLTSTALKIDLKASQNRIVYDITNADEVIRINAITGVPLLTLEQDARKLAQQDFTGDGEIISIEQGTAPTLETRKHSGSYWRLNFSDSANSSYYISVATGEILERRNTIWRIRDVAWMLHIMDYSGRKDFNNSLIIIIALTAVWLGVSGLLLLFYSFSLHDFWFINFLASRRKAAITLIEPASGKTQTVRLRKGSILFIGLALQGINLPSICGGGGQCGKCKVSFEPAEAPEANKLEQSLIPKRRRERGVRLSCQYRVQGNISVQVPEGTLETANERIEGVA
jgi:Na+-transporting NADH:ubiquinone oxidoreductase subunit F